MVTIDSERGLVKGNRIGVDASTMEANVVLRAIVRRADGATYRAMLEQLAKQNGIATHSAEGPVRLDRKRKGKRLPYNNRARLRSGVAREVFRLWAELVERRFALTLDRGGMRRAWLRGGEPADSDRSQPGFPRRSRPLFRSEAGHHSEMKPATQPRF